MGEPSTVRLCTTCGVVKPLAEMMPTRTRSGKTYFRGRCRGCDNERRRVRAEKNPRDTYFQSRTARLSEMRARGEQVDFFILEDSRRSDRKASLQNDLDREFIREAIKDGCFYCGETELRMTLDRIDNERGHTKDNVVSACIRCNYTRKDMPYAAWLVVAEGMKVARENGLFRDWTGRVR